MTTFEPRRLNLSATRCEWPGHNDFLMTEYHDHEWGVPLHDDQKLFEFLILEGAQAGLSWQTVLKKRKSYRDAFNNFDPEKVARYTQQDQKRLIANPGIIRNKLKIQSAINNARSFLKIQEKYGSFDSFIWKFVDGKPIQNKWKTIEEIPAKTQVSDRISKELKKSGLTFVGSTIIYAHMQATGMVNDHIVSCFRYGELR